MGVSSQKAIPSIKGRKRRSIPPLSFDQVHMMLKDYPIWHSSTGSPKLETHDNFWHKLFYVISEHGIPLRRFKTIFELDNEENTAKLQAVIQEMISVLEYPLDGTNFLGIFGTEEQIASLEKALKDARR